MPVVVTIWLTARKWTGLGWR